MSGSTDVLQILFGSEETKNASALTNLFEIDGIMKSTLANAYRRTQLIIKFRLTPRFLLASYWPRNVINCNKIILISDSENFVFTVGCTNII